MQTEFAPMTSLGFPSHELVGARSKKIRECLSDIRQALRKETGFGLDLHPWAATQRSGRRQRGNTSATTSSSNSNSSNNNIEAIHVQGKKRRLPCWDVPGLDSYGQIVRDSSCGISCPTNPSLEMGARASLTWPPAISEELQDTLIDIHYDQFHFYLPLMKKQDMKYQLQQCRLNMPTTYLSPFFFYALFASAATLSSELEIAAEYFFQQALAFREAYAGYSSLSSVLALIMMAHYLESTKQRRNTAHAWLLAGEACRMAQDLGLHRQGSGQIDPEERAFGIRTFWIAFATDRIMSLVYGKPFVFHEEDMDVSLPSCTPSERSGCVDIEQQMSNFNCIINVSKVAGRIIKMNYAAKATRMREHLHQGAMLSTLDSWISTLVKETVTPYHANSIQQQRFDKMRTLVWHVLLILLHIPYIDHDIANSNKKSPEFRPSLDICNNSAIIITHLLYQIPPSELQELATRPFIIHAILTATRVHLMNASFPYDHESVIFGEISFLMCMKILRSLPSAQHADSWLPDTINAFQKQFDNRTEKIVSDYASTHLEHIISLFSSISEDNNELVSRPWSAPDSDLISSSSTGATSSSVSTINNNSDNDGSSIRIIQCDPSSGTTVSRQSSSHRQNGRGQRRRVQQQQQQQQQSSPKNESPRSQNSNCPPAVTQTVAAAAAAAAANTTETTNNGLGQLQVTLDTSTTISSNGSNLTMDYFAATNSTNAAFPQFYFEQQQQQEATVNQNMFANILVQGNQGGFAANASCFQGDPSTNVQYVPNNELRTFHFPISTDGQPTINDMVFNLPNTTMPVATTTSTQFWYHSMS